MSWMLGFQGMPAQAENDNQRVLADALRFRDQVVGILGHDLRNPLSAITALARVTMQREDLPGDVGERLAQIDRAMRLGRGGGPRRPSRS